jgi:hypothetical protein
MNKSVGRSGARMRLLSFVVLVALLAWALAAAGPATAAPGPTGPTYTLDQLRTALAGSPGGLQGYFKTVLSGSTISVVPVQILAVADGQNPVDGSSLIFFQITDKAIVDEGGLAEGMSGSPVYVGDPAHPDPVNDPLIGAAAYGDDFTTNGLGLATPIQFMTSIETNYSVAPLDKAMATAAAPTAPALEGAGPILPKTRTALADRPVKTADGTYGRFVVARSRTVARTLHPAAGTAVFVPLSAVEIGGLPSTSAAYKRLAADFAKRGVDVRAVGAGGGDPGFTADLVGGASVAAVLSSGDFWAAYVGTVTYAHDNVVVAFGHPAALDGPTGLDMANADVYGIWSDSLASYKLVSLGATRGLITQDRTYGIAGELGATTPEVPVTASAGIGTGTPVTIQSDVPLWVADNPNYGEDLISSACYFAVFKAADAGLYPGHATMDSSVTVADAGAPGTPYTTTMDNVFDDTTDVSGYAGADVYDMMSELLSNPNGTAPAQMATSPGAVTFSATLTPADASLQVLDFSVPGGLKHGTNTVRALVRSYGEVGTHEEDLSLFLPARVATTGSLTVYDSGGLDADPPSDWSDRFAPMDSAIAPSETLPDLVGEVRGWLLNDSLNATFIADVPNDFEVPVGPDGQPTNAVTASRAMIENGTTWFVQGSVAKDSAYMRLRPGVRSARRGHVVRLYGTMDAEDATGTTVAVYRGSSTTPFTHVPVHVDAGGQAYFTVRLKMGASTTRFKAVWGGSDSYLGDTARCTVRRAR